LTADGRIGASLVGHKDIAGVCFTGSMATAKAISATLARNGRAALPFIAETGGINAMIVDSSSLPEQVVRDVLTSAFQSAGQRCSALRLLCLQEECAERVLSLLRGALDTLRIGDPSQIDTDIGPLIDADAQRLVRAYLASQKPIAAAPLDPTVAARGWFIAPTIIEVGRVSDVKQEVFGPVLHVMRFAASDLSAWVHEINLQGYGLTLGIHSRIRRRVQSIVNAADVGNIYVNRHQVGAVVAQQPFGGHGLSGTGPKAGGPHYLLRLSRSSSSRSEQLTQALTMTSQPIDSRITAIVTHARQAQAHWRRTARRAEMIQFACQLLSANTSQSISQVAETLRVPGATDLQLALPCIAGETNDLQLKPRGVLLCLGGGANAINSLAAQIIMCVSTGNAVVAVVDAESSQGLRELVALLQQSGVPDHLITCVELPTAQLPSAWLTTLAIDGVVFDGTEAEAHRIADYLQQRRGALLPLISSTADVFRFCLEQTVTTNTAAAGGDPHLLGMAG
jgi:RHH-type proline utilization regulon transcriptional repressor/proline dehydrogenase/delta 1-pyrroline-5-carboxylate dehydrogenase